MSLIQLGLAAGCMGFRIWNWPPAKIFMGDVGSGFLGFIVGALAIASAALGILSIWTWLILIGAFFVDSTVTLMYRMFSGARWLEGHRSHAYQRAARRFHGHLPVTASITAINVCWLFPLAWYSAQRTEFGW